MPPGKGRPGGHTPPPPGTRGLGPGEAGRAGAGRAGSIQTNRPPLCCPQLPFTKDNPDCISGFPFQLPGGGGPRAQQRMRPKNPLPIGGPGYVAPMEWGGKVPSRAVEKAHLPAAARAQGVREEGTGNPTEEPQAPLAGGGRSGKTPLLAGAQPSSPALPPPTSGAPRASPPPPAWPPGSAARVPRLPCPLPALRPDGWPTGRPWGGPNSHQQP